MFLSYSSPAQDGDCVLPDDYFAEGSNLAEAMQDCLKSTLQPGNSLVSSGVSPCKYAFWRKPFYLTASTP